MLYRLALLLLLRPARATRRATEAGGAWGGLLISGVQWSGARLSEHQQRLERSVREQSSQLSRLTSEALKGSLASQVPLMRLLQEHSFDAAEILAAASDRIAALDLRARLGGRLEEWLRSQNEWRRARAFMKDEGVADFSGAWRMQEVTSVAPTLACNSRTRLHVEHSALQAPVAFPPVPFR
eukprot:scaffold32545_cov31-Tisochrysis_lutea.AAC.1